jgi:DNA ligase-associated metallophosphoesterase
MEVIEHNASAPLHSLSQNALCHKALTRTIASHSFSFLPHRALWWHKTRTLIIADVHLGKAETLASNGVPAPDGIAARDLARVSHLLNTLYAQRLLILGDLLHAPIGLTSELVASVAAWRSQHADVAMQIVPGNHDRKLSSVAAAWQLDILPELHDEQGVRFVHEPPTEQDVSRSKSSLPTLCGHLHPMTIVRGKGDRLRLPAFLLSRDAANNISQVILPAFSSFASGVALRHTGETLAIAGDEVIALLPQTLNP